MGVAKALLRATSKADDAARVVSRTADDTSRLIQSTNGVQRLKQQMPPPTVSQLEFEVDRAAQITRKGDEAARFEQQRVLLAEAADDPVAMARLRKEDPELDRLMTQYNDRDVATASVDKNLKGKLKKRYEEQSSLQSSVAEYTADDPKAFRTALEKKLNKERLMEMKTRGEVPSGEPALEQHHLVPKGITAAFFNRADELVAAGKGSRQDVLAMAKYLEEVTDTAGGDRASNILAMRKAPHNEFHTYMEVGEGMEESKKIWQKRLSEIDSIDELFAEWEKWIEAEGKYYKDTAEVWEPLENILEEITGIPKDKRQKYQPPKKTKK